MSYCRFSSDNFSCDAYVYEYYYGGWTINLAESRIVGDIPKVPSYLECGIDEYMDAHKKQMEFIKTAKHEPIELPYSGETFNYGTAKECAEQLKYLVQIGYIIPKYAIDALMEEVDT